MKKVEELKLELEHMENRTQWHQKDVKRVEELRNEVAAAACDGILPEAVKEQNRVRHEH